MFRPYLYDVTKLAVGCLMYTLRSFLLQCWLPDGGKKMCLYMLCLC